MIRKICEPSNTSSVRPCQLLWRWFIVLCSIILGGIHGVKAQYLLSSKESDFLSRRIITVRPFRLIYPKGVDSLARESLRYTLQYEPASRLGGKTCRYFPIMLRTKTSVSNGMVSFVPARMELYALTSRESATPVPWLDHLVSHELRHRAQMIALNRNWYKALTFVVGQQALGVAAAQVPIWFLEGDAIYNESKLSGYGRANEATTYQQYRVELLTGNVLKYDQYLYRSLRYKVPNHYHFGSAMVEYGVYKHGEQYWENVLRYTTLRPFYIMPFGIGQKKYGGATPKQTWENAMQAMDSIFRANVHGELDTLPQQRGKYNEVRYPYELPHLGKQYYWQNSFHKRSRLVEYDTIQHKERTLYEPFYRMDAPRYDSTLSAWVQLYQHPFWENVQWGDIWVYDLEKHKGVRLTHHEHYISPQPRAKIQALDAIKVNEKGQYSLVRLALEADSIIHTYQFPSDWELREVTKGLHEQSVIVRAVNAEGTRIIEFDWKRGNYRTLLEPLRMDISGIKVSPKGLYFSMSYDYMRRGFLAPWDDTFTSVLPPQEIMLPSYGVEDLTPLPSGKLLYASFGVNGYAWAQAENPTLHPIETLQQSGRLYPLHTDSAMWGTHTLPMPTDSSVMIALQSPQKVYDPVQHAFHFHSFFPFYAPGISSLTQPTTLAPGITLLSENHNSTLAIHVSYFYMHAHHGGEVGLQCKGMWPNLTLNGRVGGQPRIVQSPYEVHSQITGVHLEGDAALHFPIKGTLSRFGVWLTPYTQFHINNSMLYNFLSDEWYKHSFSMRLGMSVGASRYRATRDIFPKWGFQLQSSVRLFPTLKQLAAPVIEARGRINVPGFWHAHVIRLGAHIVSQNRSHPLQHSFNYPLRAKSFLPQAKFSRGTSFTSFDVDYTLPLGYPDWVLGCFLYIKRFYTTLFGQYAIIHHNPKHSSKHRFIGIELTMDYHVLRFQGETSTGIRIAGSPWGDDMGGKYHWPISVEVIMGVKPFPLGNGGHTPSKIETLF